MTRLHPVVNEAMRANGLTYDQWGTCLTVLGALCDVVSAAGVEAEIPSAVGYRSSPVSPWHAFPRGELGARLATFWEDGGSGEYDLQRDIVVAIDRSIDSDRFVASMRDMTMSDVAYAIRVLHRYANLLKLHGEDY